MNIKNLVRTDMNELNTPCITAKQYNCLTKNLKDKIILNMNKHFNFKIHAIIENGYNIYVIIIELLHEFNVHVQNNMLLFLMCLQ